MQLVRFTSTGMQEVVQEGFQTTYCLTATESPLQYKIAIIPTPPGVIVPELELEVTDTATLQAVAIPVNSNGIPTGAPPVNLEDLDYGVEFFLANTLSSQVLDPTTLPDGTANAILDGSNVIHAAVTSVRVVDDEPVLAFWRDSIFGFRRGSTPSEPARFESVGLPVKVNSNSNATTIIVEPVLAYEENQGGQTVLVAATKLQNQFTIPTEMWKIERNEPFESQRKYFLAVKVNVPTGVTLPNNTELTIKINRAMPLEVFAKTETKSVIGYPLNQFGGNNNRYSNKPEDFFTGSVIVPSSASPLTNLILSLTLPNGVIPPDTLFKVTNGTTDIQPNVVESAISGLNKKLVPPGENVSGKNLLLKVPLSCSANNGVAVSFPKSTLNIVPTNDENFEEYLRVFEPVQSILTNSGSNFKDFAQYLLGKLNQISNPTTNSTGIADTLKTEGAELWKRACQLVTSGYLDDRPLYWARLQSIGVIKAYAKRKGVSIDEAMMNKFEWTSRGLEADGSIKFPAIAPTNKRKAIVTGFDPFELYAGLSSQTGPDYVETSNPSGLLALNFNSEFSGQVVPVPNQDGVYVKSVVFPVRYADFNKKIVETAITPSLGSIMMLITTSQNGSVDYYDLERWAAKFRTDGFDNNFNRGTGDPLLPPVIPAGDEYLESTLPFAQVIKSSEEIESPKGMAPFVIDQSYRSVGSTQTNRSLRRTIPPATTAVVIEAEKFRPSPVLNDLDGHNIASDIPKGTSIEGSGGNYLSNEIFYRVAVERKAKRETLATGHFHVPPTGFTPTTSGSRLILGVKKALERLFSYGFRLSGPNLIEFQELTPGTAISQDLTVTNKTTEIIKVSTIEIAAPFSITLPSTVTLPITLNPGTSITLPVTFSPASIGYLT